MDYQFLYNVLYHSPMQHHVINEIIENRFVKHFYVVINAIIVNRFVKHFYVVINEIMDRSQTNFSNIFKSSLFSIITKRENYKCFNCKLYTGLNN